MIFKQLSKSKKEKEISYKSLDVEDDKAEISSVTLDEFKKIPKDNAYSSSKTGNGDKTNEKSSDSESLKENNSDENKGKE